jgi:hypothetical protein
MANPFEPGRATGPRTDSGKLVSSANATSHGLTARRPLCEEEAERMLLIVQKWTLKHMPETEPEEALIQSAAIEYVRYLRCVDAEERRLGPASRAALDAWEEKRRHAVRRRGQDLERDPEGVVADLLGSAFGIDWMIKHWVGLRDRLDSGKGWTGDDLARALQLLGRLPRRPAEADVDVRRLYDAVVAAYPASIDARLTPGQLADESAALRLRQVVADRIDRLESLRAEAWEAVDEPEALAVESESMLDPSPQGQLRQRYRREALRDMRSSLNQIMRLKVERSKSEHREARLDRSPQAPRPSEAPAWTAPQSSAGPIETPRPPEPGPAPVDSRNEPPRPPRRYAEDRQNPIQERGFGNPTSASSSDSDWRTGPPFRPSEPPRERGTEARPDPRRPSAAPLSRPRTAPTES